MTILEEHWDPFASNAHKDHKNCGVCLRFLRGELWLEVLLKEGVTASTIAELMHGKRDGEPSQVVYKWLSGKVAPTGYSVDLVEKCFYGSDIPFYLPLFLALQRQSPTARILQQTIESDGLSKMLDEVPDENPFKKWLHGQEWINQVTCLLAKARLASKERDIDRFVSAIRPAIIKLDEILPHQVWLLKRYSCLVKTMQNIVDEFPTDMVRINIDWYRMYLYALRSWYREQDREPTNRFKLLFLAIDLPQRPQPIEIYVK